MQIRALASTPPAPPVAPAPTAASTEPAWPVDSATLYVPREGGEFQPIVKVPVQSRGAYETEVSPGVHRAISPDRRTLRVLDGQGHERFAFESPDYVQGAEYHAGTDTWFVRSSKAIHRVDGATGQETGRVEPERLNCLGDMALLDDGDVALAIPLGYKEGGRVLRLGPDLQPRWTAETKLEPDHVMDLGHGHVAVFDDGEALTILDDQGKVRLDSPDLKLYSALVHEDRLYFLRSVPSKYDRKSSELVRYDPATGATRITKVGREAERIVPLPGGGCLTEEGEAGHPRIRVYDEKGKKQKDFRFPDGFVRQLHLSRNGQTALVVLGDDTKRLYRLDLGADTSFLGRLLPGGDEPKLLLEQKEEFTPTLLGDGRIALAHARGFETMNLDGGDRRPARASDLQAAGIASQRCATSYIACDATVSTPARADAVLNHAHSAYDLPVPSTGLFVTADDCLNFALPTVSSLPFTVTRSVEGSQDLLRRALFASKEGDAPPPEAPFPGSPDWKLQFGREALQVTGPFGVVQERYSPGRRDTGYSTALPLQSRGTRHVAAATSDGRVQWIDVDKKDGTLTYDLGEPITSLSLEPGAVVATTSGGAFLRLEAPGAEPTPEAAPQAEAAAGSAGIEVADDVVRIGGVVITRRG